jgi:hypothetical protein
MCTSWLHDSILFTFCENWKVATKANHTGDVLQVIFWDIEDVRYFVLIKYLFLS